MSLVVIGTLAALVHHPVSIAHTEQAPVLACMQSGLAGQEHECREAIKQLVKELHSHNLMHKLTTFFPCKKLHALSYENLISLHVSSLISSSRGDAVRRKQEEEEEDEKEEEAALALVGHVVAVGDADGDGGGDANAQ